MLTGIFLCKTFVTGCLGVKSKLKPLYRRTGA